MSLRGGTDTVRQLEIVKAYLLEITETPAESTSEVIREAIKFGSIWCRQTRLVYDEQKADQKMEELVDPDVQIRREA